MPHLEADKIYILVVINTKLINEFICKRIDYKLNTKNPDKEYPEV